MLTSWTKTSSSNRLNINKHSNLSQVMDVIVYTRLYIRNKLLRVLISLKVLLATRLLYLSHTLLLWLSFAFMFILLIKVIIIIIVIINIIVSLRVYWLIISVSRYLLIDSDWSWLTKLTLRNLLLFILFTVIWEYEVLVRNLIPILNIIRRA
jgi:hypothetical protein